MSSKPRSKTADKLSCNLISQQNTLTRMIKNQEDATKASYAIVHIIAKTNTTFSILRNA